MFSGWPVRSIGIGNKQSTNIFTSRTETHQSQVFLRARNSRTPLATLHFHHIVGKQTRLTFPSLSECWQTSVTFYLLDESREGWLMNLKWRRESVRVRLCDRRGQAPEKRCARINTRNTGQVWLSAVTRASLPPPGSASDAFTVVDLYLFALGRSRKTRRMGDVERKDRHLTEWKSTVSVLPANAV